MNWLRDHYRIPVRAALDKRYITFGVASFLFAIAIFLTVGGAIGSEFLPHLDEGALWVRGTLPPSEGPTGSIEFSDKARQVMASFPEDTQAARPVGRPEDGTATT